MTHARPARSQKVLDREYATAFIVGQDRGVVRVGRLAHRIDHGHDEVVTDRRPRVAPAARDNDAVYSPGQQGLYVMLLSDRVISAIAEQDGELTGL